MSAEYDDDDTMGRLNSRAAGEMSERDNFKLSQRDSQHWVEQADDLRRLLGEREKVIPVRQCRYFPTCLKEGEYVCRLRICCCRYGCKERVCEDHRNQNKFCMCLDQRDMVSCETCEPKLREKASWWQFYIPIIIFLLANICAFTPSILNRVKTMQEEQFQRRLEFDLQYHLNEQSDAITLQTAATASADS